jgi:type IV secretory pathway TrbL component
MIKFLNYMYVQKVADSCFSAFINVAMLVSWSVIRIFDGTWVGTLWSYETCVLIDVFTIFYVMPSWELS